MQPRKKCSDCQHYCNLPGLSHPRCRAPQLDSVTEDWDEPLRDADGNIRQTKNGSASCNETRAFRFACGKEARWFKAKPLAQEAGGRADAATLVDAPRGPAVDGMANLHRPVTTHFTIAGPVDRRTQEQIAAALQQAVRRGGRCL